MNKFGIFNLLNSFFQLTPQQNSSTSENSNASPDLLSSLISSLTKPPEQKNAPSKIEPKPFLPLQQSMLSTISSHDEFVKRVKEKELQK